MTEIEVFVAIIDNDGFTGAANKLKISKSSVSKHIMALESRLGVTLLNRTTRNVRPTDIGLNYYEKCDDCPDEHTCPVHKLMVEVRDSTLDIFNNKSLADLIV